uniref:Uncharacterized protein n=1 Tax=Siphoviridae sp. cttFh17 TaxID=2826491 RepID=A0A8S5NIA2_9CAUD|nr:MAG TPA: hypothetical protein [Siphoviridae sp. cttFh17]
MEGNVCRHRKDVYRSNPQGRICRFYNYIRRINLCTDSEFDYNSHNYGCRFKGKCSYYIVKGRLFQSASIPKTQNELNKIYLCYTQIINDSKANDKSE